MAALTILSLIILNLMLICVSAQKQNISLGSTLISSENSKLVSLNGKFAFGFYAITPTLYVVGVWFDDIPTKTLAWTAMKDRRDIPVKRMSTLRLGSSGLTLYDDQSNTKWSSDHTSNIVIQAAMLDTGNFVLLNASSSVPIWQSFDYPTETLLPGQTLKTNSYMFSKISTTNYSTGRFQLFMQNDGNLVIYPMKKIGGNDAAYWSTKPLSFEASLKFDASGLLYLVSNTNKSVKNVTEGGFGRRGLLRRMTLESDGILAQYVWNTSNASWLSVWQPANNTCQVTSQCGPNGICQLNIQNKPVCICPPQLNFIDNNDHFKGCIRSTSQGKTCRIANSTMFLLVC